MLFTYCHIGRSSQVLYNVHLDEFVCVHRFYVFMYGVCIDFM